MSINEKSIFEAFQRLSKKHLKEFLISSFHEMNNRQRRNVFLELQNTHELKNGGPDLLYSKINKLYEKSERGDYYAPFNMNSKNYMDIPEETDAWFSELSHYLDEASKLVKKKKYLIANKCFEKLFDLIKMMEYEEVVFADEYGTWMIENKLDYNEAYITSLSQTERAEKFAEKVLPLLIRDSRESFSEKVYDKISRIANPNQFSKVQEIIKSKDIRIQ